MCGHTWHRRLGHLERPERAAVIDRYLAAHSRMDDDQREYALAARSGDVHDPRLRAISSLWNGLE